MENLHWKYQESNLGRVDLSHLKLSLSFMFYFPPPLLGISPLICLLCHYPTDLYNFHSLTDWRILLDKFYFHNLRANFSRDTIFHSEHLQSVKQFWTLCVFLQRSLFFLIAAGRPTHRWPIEGIMGEAQTLTLGEPSTPPPSPPPPSPPSPSPPPALLLLLLLPSPFKNCITIPVYSF